MRLFLKPEDITNDGWDASVTAIGSFDGVHRGHHALIRQAMERAGEEQRFCIAVTFDKDPEEVLKPSANHKYITTLDQKIHNIEALGVDGLLIIPFTLEFAHTEADVFTHDILIEKLKCAEIVVGQDFHFGKNRVGNVEYLTKKGKEFGFSVTPIANVLDGGSRISSTIIRVLLAEGHVERVSEYLERNYTFEGVVVHGEQLGRSIGYPTANLISIENQVVPGDGIYAVKVRLRGKSFSGACSIGDRPTVNGERKTFEVFLTDYVGGDFYNAMVEVEFITKIRDQEKFASLDALKTQISRDVDSIEAILRIGDE